jgi:hypothetical protein
VPAPEPPGEGFRPRVIFCPHRAISTAFFGHGGRRHRSFRPRFLVLFRAHFQKLPLPQSPFQRDKWYHPGHEAPRQPPEKRAPACWPSGFCHYSRASRVGSKLDS